MKPRVTAVRGWNARSLALGIVMLFGSAISFATAAVQAAPQPVVASTQRTSQSADPLTLFARMTPVLTSPRCINCHGGTDPVSGVNHGGGAVGPGAACQDCHTASDQWQGVSGIQFDTQTMPLCQTMRHVVQVLGPTAFVNFLASDPVVGLGFDGLRGMDDNSPFWPVDADPPPMTRADFVAAAQQWVTDGNAACGTPAWTGTIVQSSSDASAGGGHDNAKSISLSVNVNGAASTATLHLEGHSFQDGSSVNGCQQFDHQTFSADGTVPAEVQVTLTAPPSPDDGSDQTSGFYLINFRITQPVKLTTVTVTQGLSGGTCRQNSTTTTSNLLPPPTGSSGVTAGTGGAINKPLDPDHTDHLSGTETQTVEGFKLTRNWDLSSN